jgi:phospholipid/cholesterol/gamma-HCH transport system substrate-binding protein
MSDRPPDRTALGAITLLVVVALFAAVFAHLPSRLSAPSGHTITAMFSDAQTLAPGDPVRVRGVQVGSVSAIETAPDGHSALARLTVSDDALPLYADAHATVRWRSLFGAAFVVDLDRGTPARGVLSRSALGLHQTDTQVLLEDVASAVARDGLRSTLHELPGALADPGQPDGALRAATSSADPIAAGMRAVRGRRPGDLQRLIAATADTVGALDAPDDAMNALVEGAAGTFAVTARRREDIQRAIAAAGDILPRVRSTAQRLVPTLDLADGLLGRLEAATGRLAPAATRLRGTLVAARGLLGDAEPLFDRLRPAVSSLASAARIGDPVLRRFTPVLDGLATRVLPGLAEEVPGTGHAGYEMVGPTAAGVDGALASFDADSFFIRFTASFGESSLDAAPCRTALTDPTAAQIATCDSLVAALKKVLGP